MGTPRAAAADEVPIGLLDELGQPVADDVETATLVRAPIFVRVRRVRLEEKRVARRQIVVLVAHADPERTGEQDDGLVRTQSMGFAVKNTLGVKAKFVDLQPSRGSRRRQQSALDAPVARTERRRISGLQESSGLRLIRSEQGIEGHLQSDRDLPEHRQARIRSARLDLRQSGAAHTARQRELVQRQSALLSQDAQTVCDAPGQHGRAHVVAEPVDFGATGGLVRGRGRPIRRGRSDSRAGFAAGCRRAH